MGKKYATRATILLAALLFAACREEKKTPPAADFFLVVDTSGSMASKTMQKVKEKLPAILATIHTGDRVHLSRFDEKALPVLDTVITSDADREKVVSAITALEPRGRYTDMKELLAFLKQAVAAPQGDGPKYVIVLSDGIDDPAPQRNPRNRRPRVDLHKYEASEKLAVQEPYIFYIHLGEAGTDQALKENLKAVSKDVQVVKPGEQKADLGLTDVQKQIDAGRQPAEGPWYRRAWERFLSVPLKIRLAVGGGVLVLLALIYAIFFRKKKPLYGSLLYWENEEHPSMAREVKLSKFRRNDVIIGSMPGSLVRIREATFPPRVRLKARGRGPNFHFGAAKKDLQRMVFLVQKKPGRISSGDTFRINNYTFEYSHGSKK